MPIKFPKFTRRKSAGNALEAEYEPANIQASGDADGHREGGSTGFTVFARPNRGSSNTSSTAYSGPDYAGSSNRLSSSSTLPSADAPRTPDDYRPHLTDIHGGKHGGEGGLYPYGYSRPTKAATSGPGGFGGFKSRETSTVPRRGTMTEATPPKLDTSLDTSSLFDDDMFDFTGPKKQNNISNTHSGIGSITPTAPKIASNAVLSSSGNNANSSPAPPPKSYDPAISPTASRFQLGGQHGHGETSPYAWEDSTNDALNVPGMASPRTSRMLTPGQKSSTFSHSRTDSLEAPSSRPVRTNRGSGGDSAPLKRGPIVPRRGSAPIEDQDAMIVAGSVTRNLKGPRPQPDSVRMLSDKSKDRDSGWEETLPSASSSDQSLRSTGSSKDTTLTTPFISRGNTESDIRRAKIESANATPKANQPGLSKPSIAQVQDDDEPLDVTISTAAALAAKYESNGPHQDIPQNKVMTRAQFERYQQQQDDQRRLSGKDQDDDDSIMSDEEESETERNRQAAKQREKQDAHLSVYRQQMMKITGTEQSNVPLGMQSRPASLSTPILPISQQPGVKAVPAEGVDSSDDEDEEIPLGILMAHGFPAKNRPPTRLASSSSQPNLRQAAQQDARLPPFARGLPQDPYNLGASIVNPTARMSLALHAGGSDARSVAGGGSVYGGSTMGPPRGGLVGEIMRAEEQKAARRGLMPYPQQKDPFGQQDPFARAPSPGGGMLGLGGGLQSGMQQPMQQPMGNGMMGGMPGMPGMGMPGVPGGMGVGMQQSAIDPQNAMQVQMANQMQQMMQMQMQWMQMQMQAQQQQQAGGQFLNPMMGGPMMGGGAIGPRPSSTMSANSPISGGLAVPMMQQRPMSVMDQQFVSNQRPGYAPSIAASHRGFPGMQPGYTPSIAPSERSNIGLPSRYRPVTHQPAAPSNAGRTATLTSSSLPHGHSQLAQKNADDDDEDSGWEELNKKRQQKKDGWKKKKEGGGLSGLLSGFGSTSTTR